MICTCVFKEIRALGEQLANFSSSHFIQKEKSTEWNSVCKQSVLYVCEIYHLLVVKAMKWIGKESLFPLPSIFCCCHIFITLCLLSSNTFSSAIWQSKHSRIVDSCANRRCKEILQCQPELCPSVIKVCLEIYKQWHRSQEQNVTKPGKYTAGHRE